MFQGRLGAALQDVVLLLVDPGTVVGDGALDPAVLDCGPDPDRGGRRVVVANRVRTEVLHDDPHVRRDGDRGEVVLDGHRRAGEPVTEVRHHGVDDLVERDPRRLDHRIEQLAGRAGLLAEFEDPRRALLDDRERPLVGRVLHELVGVAVNEVRLGSNVVSEHPVEHVQPLLLADVLPHVVEDHHSADGPVVAVRHAPDGSLVRSSSVRTDDGER